MRPKVRRPETTCVPQRCWPDQARPPRQASGSRGGWGPTSPALRRPRCPRPRVSVLDHLGQSAATRGLVVRTGPEGGPARGGRGIRVSTPRRRRQPARWPPWPNGIVGVMQLGDPDAGKGEASAQGPRTRPVPPSRPPRCAGLGGSGSAAQGGPGPHGRDQLGVVVPAFEAAQLTESRRPQDAVHGQRRVALEVAQGP